MRRLRSLPSRLLVATLVAVLAAPVSAHAQAPAQASKPEDVRALVDAELTDHLAKLLDFESTYLASAGRYFQALASHSTPPDDGKTLPPDKLNAGPTDQVEKLSYLWQQLQLDAALPYSSQVDVYDGPKGRGYVLTVSVLLGGELWVRAINTGPEAYREAAWHPVTVERLP